MLKQMNDTDKFSCASALVGSVLTQFAEERLQLGTSETDSLLSDALKVLCCCYKYYYHV
jgi:hypothetical protein